VYATGFDAITGAFDRIDIEGVGGEKLADKWHAGPVTYLGLMVHGFPNFVMLAGPQSGSASTNFPRGIETGVDWTTDFLTHLWDKGLKRAEPTAEVEAEWVDHVAMLYEMLLLRKGKGWFTGYNSNVDGHEEGVMRLNVYNGGSPKFVRTLTDVVTDNYRGITCS